MKMKLVLPAEKDADYAVVHKKIAEIIEQWVPFLFKDRARKELESAKGKKIILETIQAALDAAEKAREKKSVSRRK